MNSTHHTFSLPKRISDKIIIQPNGCWYWTGCTVSSGYGQVSFEGKPRFAHRVIRYLIRKDIPVKATPNTILDHGGYCGIKKCVNPWHTTSGSSRDNSRTSRSVCATGSIHSPNTCRNGHDLTKPENVFINRRGDKHCIICNPNYGSMSTLQSRLQPNITTSDYNEIQYT